ncbi:MAG: hypothetical protein IT221_07315 [Fluviicola sp.]|nr:hypothetical protein [Fluviicola sp.]
MKTKTILTLATVVAATTFLASCGKYEDGPGFTLLTKKARLTGEWDIKEYVDGSDGSVVAETSSDTYLIEKDGTITIKSGNVSTKGTWEFVSDKEQLSVTVPVVIFGVTYSEPEISTITRLTNKELWIKDTDGSGDVTKLEKI